MNLPDSVKAIAEHVPAEDLALAILRARLTDIEIATTVRANQTFPLILARRLPTFLDFPSDERFITSVDLAVHVFAEDPDGDRDAAIISEACRVVLRDAWLNNFTDPALGSVHFFDVLSPARRATDWATASGPVQYADLPAGVWRYEARYRLVVRKPRIHPFASM